MSQPQPQASPGIMQRLEMSYSNHKVPWNIGIAAVVLFISWWIWRAQGTSSNGASSAVGTSNDTGSAVTNGTAPADTQQADYNSIMTALTALFSQLGQNTTSGTTSGTTTSTGVIAGVGNGINPLPPTLPPGVMPPANSVPTISPVIGSQLPPQTPLSASYYISQPGDTINKIAAMWGTSAYAVEHTPGNWTDVHIGQVAMNQDRSGQSNFWDLLPWNTKIYKPS